MDPTGLPLTGLPLARRVAAQGPPLSYRAFVPSGRSPGSRPCPPLVLVHGRRRAATRQFRAFLPMAIARGVALIAPTFPAQRFSGYQFLAGTDGPLCARDALLGTLDDAWQHLGVGTDEVDLVGFSGGAQFAHRFAMSAPGRVRRAVVAAAGWYTYLDEDRPFPRGAGAAAGGAGGGGECVDVAAFLRIPVHVLVGDRDVGRGPSLRTGPSIDRRQGVNRIARALRWTDHLEDVARARDLAPGVSFDLLADTGHSFTEAVERGGLVARTFDFLGPAVPLLAGPTGPMPR
jgi:pimeloyl-ACP methyl ester carboxylesterase